MPRPHLSLALATATALLSGACSSAEPTDTPAPLLEVSDAYELAGAQTLPEVAPSQLTGLRNLYHLSDTVLSGSEPNGEGAFAELEALGVRTVLSVDGKVPDAESARRHGMRYVHVPIRYNGIEDEELLQIAKAFRELEAPFYVHCFHGRHRGPAAAAVGRVVLDGAERERVVAEMRQWCGTSKTYSGLYETLARKPIPGAKQTEQYDWDFPAAKPMGGFRQAMVEIPRLNDDIERIADNDWRPDPEHPDIDALNEARTLLGLFRRASDLKEVAARPSGFQDSLGETVNACAQLVAALERVADGAGTTARQEALTAFDSLQEQCSSCHKAYRNAR
jgi:hypothetical protein